MNIQTVLLLDTDEKLEGLGLNIVAKFEDVVVEEGEKPETTLLKLALDGTIKTKLENHNNKRTEIVNKVTLERTGVEVKLQPISIQDVTIVIK